MLKIIFLDIDGVLVNRASLRQASGLQAFADPKCVAALNRIIAETDAKIVVSSTWRRSGRRFVTQKLRSWGVVGEIVGLTPILNVANVERGSEIQTWIHEHMRFSSAIDSFVILDDDDDMLHLSARLVQTVFEDGLTESDADRAIEILRMAKQVKLIESERGVKHEWT